MTPPKGVIPDSVDRTQMPLVELTLEQLNHERALLALKRREKGGQARQLQKDLGDINKSDKAIELEMLKRDPRYEQAMLEIEEESEEE
jgi:hypothetical protein